MIFVDKRPYIYQAFYKEKGPSLGTVKLRERSLTALNHTTLSPGPSCSVWWAWTVRTPASCTRSTATRPGTSPSSSTRRRPTRSLRRTTSRTRTASGDWSGIVILSSDWSIVAPILNSDWSGSGSRAPASSSRRSTSGSGGARWTTGCAPTSPSSTRSYTTVCPRTRCRDSLAST